MPRTQASSDARESRTPLGHYLWHSRFLVLLTLPLIYICVIPFLLLDAAISLYQRVCFPVYGIPAVSRKDHFHFDRGKLLYLNLVERLNCVYCSYANGIASYVSEIAARTEQHWCPIQHRKASLNRYSRQEFFLPFGDARAYRSGLEEVRRDFRDLERHGGGAVPPLRHFAQPQVSKAQKTHGG